MATNAIMETKPLPRVGISKYPSDKKKENEQNLNYMRNRLEKRILSSDASPENNLSCFHISKDGKGRFLPDISEYEQTVRLQSRKPLLLKQIVTFEDGPHKGCHALIIKPDMSECFEFLKLPGEVRNMVYEQYIKNDVICISKRRDFELTYAPGFGAKNRLALLRTNKQIRSEGSEILFKREFQFSSTCALAAFLRRSLVPNPPNQPFLDLRKITINTFAEKSSKDSFELLKYCKRLKSVKISYMYRNLYPRLAARKFYKDAKPFLRACVTTKGVEETLAIFNFSPYSITWYREPLLETELADFMESFMKRLTILKAKQEID